MPSKYSDPGNPVVTIEINGVSLHNILIDLGAEINVMSVKTMKTLQLDHLRPTQTFLELLDKSFINPTGSLDDITVTLASWENPMDFLVIDQNLDQGSKICSIFKVLGMRQKRCHCVRLVLLIPAVYLFSQTESVWRSYRDLFESPNRKKKGADWAGRTADVAEAVQLTGHPYMTDVGDTFSVDGCQRIGL
jgi:hypothetical protein